MKNLIKENQEDYKLQKHTWNTGKGKTFKLLMLRGLSKEWGELLRSRGEKMGQKYNAKWGGQYGFDKDVWFWFVNEKDENGEPDYSKIIDEKIAPIIREVNTLHQYTLSIDELVEQLDNYTPKQVTDEIIATPEEASEVKNKLLEFKERILNMSSSEEIKNVINILKQVKSGKGYPYSANNKLMIKTQRPNATMCMSRDDWFNFYNREIRDGAKPVFIYKQINKGGEDIRQIEKRAETEYLQGIGKSKAQLTGPEKSQLKSTVLNSRRLSNPVFIVVGHFDVSDTIQIEGKTDYIQNASNAQNQNANTIDAGETTTDERVIKPVNNGLVAYANSQGMDMSRQGANSSDANSTKLLAKSILSQILHTNYMKDRDNYAQRFQVTGLDSSAARAQQAEVASWWFMESFDISISLNDINMDIIFGTTDNPRGQISTVLSAIEGAVNHLVDFVNVHIKDNANISEIEGEVPQGKHVSVMDIAKTLGVQNMVNNGIQELYESITRKLKRRL